MKNIHLCIVLIVHSLTFNACSSSAATPSIPKKETFILPTWYLNPPSNSEEYIYGVGTGDNLDNARKQALEAMVSQLGISIASTYESKLNFQKSYEEHFTKEIFFEIKSQVTKIHISNYEVIKSQRLNYKEYVVLVRSKKAQFTQALKKKVEHKIKKIQLKYEQVKSSDVLNRCFFYEKSVNNLSKMLPSILTLDTLGSEVEIKNYFQLHNKLNRELEVLRARMSVSIHADATNLLFKDELLSTLCKKYTCTQKQQFDINHIVIFLKSNTNYSQSYGFSIAKTTLSLALQDNQGKIIGVNTLNLTGYSTQGKELARYNTRKQLRTIIEKQGIPKIIGIK